MDGSGSSQMALFGNRLGFCNQLYEQHGSNELLPLASHAGIALPTIIFYPPLQGLAALDRLKRLAPKLGQQAEGQGQTLAEGKEPACLQDQEMKSPPYTKL